jgi:ABC-type glutathione transport system ATPase component
MVSPAVLEVVDVTKTFPVAGGAVARALNGLSFALGRGEAVGIVGESGGGKSTLARAIAGFETPDGGNIYIHTAEGRRLALRDLSGDALRVERRKIQIVFQDPGAALDPRWRIDDSVAEALAPQRGGSLGERRRLAAQWMERAGLSARCASRRPHELSAGEKQRAAMARALAAEPNIIIFDEPTASLDVSTRAELLASIRALRRETPLSMLWISHDLRTVAHVCDRALVLFLGRVVEELPAAALASGDLLHPYSRLLAAAAGLAEWSARPTRLPADARAVPPGCAFHPSCPIASADYCKLSVPRLEAASGRSGHFVACPFVIQ